jgi:ribosome-binding protein aMBF1 (putative translation factor)
MKKLIIRKVRQRCSVSGCRSIDSYLISKTAAYAKPLFICKDCLSEFYDAIVGAAENAEPTDEVVKKKTKPRVKKTPADDTAEEITDNGAEEIAAAIAAAALATADAAIIKAEKQQKLPPYKKTLGNWKTAKGKA